ncbi:MAG: hypothetical protein ACYC33_06050 [Thermoleophilia bacterium]
MEDEARPPLDPEPEDLAEGLSPSFRVTTAFLRRHPRYRHTLSLTPEHFRFDPVLWHSSIAALRGMLFSVAEGEGLEVGEDDVQEAVRNLVEGIILRSRSWDS